MRLIETARDVADGIDALIARDRRLEKIYSITGMPPLRRTAPGFRALLYIITEQQISLSAAAAIWHRTEEYLTPISPSSLLAADDRELRKAGQSRAKIASMRQWSACPVQPSGRLDTSPQAAPTWRR